MNRRNVKFGTLVLLLGLSDTIAQIVGVDICACQPLVYAFTFNFALSCLDFDVTGPGIDDSACIVDFAEGADVTDLSPVAVSRVEILELDQFLQVVAQTQINGDFRTGDIFQYTSITATQPGMVDASSIPRGFQLSITGRNQVDQTIVNNWIVVYDNDCGIFPVVTEGMAAGWTYFSDIGDPPQAVCPLSNNNDECSSAQDCDPNADCLQENESFNHWFHWQWLYLPRF